MLAGSKIMTVLPLVVGSQCRALRTWLATDAMNFFGQHTPFSWFTAALDWYWYENQLVSRWCMQGFPPVRT